MRHDGFLEMVLVVGLVLLVIVENDGLFCHPGEEVFDLLIFFLFHVGHGVETET